LKFTRSPTLQRPSPTATVSPNCGWYARPSNSKQRSRCVRQHHARLSRAHGLRPSVERVQEAGLEARASPRVLKPAEERIVHFLLKLEAPSEAICRPARLAPPNGSAGVWRLQPQRQRRHRANAWISACPAYAHA
jgi:hypothetical protein